MTAKNEQHIVIDFASNKLTYRRLHGGGRGQPLAKAIGLKTYKLPLTVLDVTAGFGTDAFMLASLGCQVTMLEREPLLYTALENAINNGRLNADIKDICDNMYLIKGNAIDIMPNFTKYDVVYIDPMFPHKNKNSLVKQPMRILQELVGADNDAYQLLPLARKIANKRVVVKRPKIAPYLNDDTPKHSNIGKSTRFDIYTPLV